MRRVITAGAIAAVLVVIALIIASPGESVPGGLRIGSPDDTSGLIVDHMLRTATVDGEHVVEDLSALAIKDCCTSRAEWALSSEALDAAIMCPDAARRLVEKDARFVIVGPCLANSDVVLVRGDSTPQRVAFTQNRDYQVDVIADRFGAAAAATPMVTSAIPYAYERGTVGGAVIDALKARHLEGEWLPSTLGDGGDRVTYVLVVSTEFRDSDAYPGFIGAFEQSVTELNDPATLADAVGAYKGDRLTGEEAEKWKRQQIRFLSTTLAVDG